MHNVWTIFGVGFLAGIGSAFFGIGGGVILVTFMTLVLQFPQHTANGVSLVALLFPVGILGVLQYYRAGKIQNEHLVMGLWMAAGLFIGTGVGAQFALGVSGATLRKSFALFLLFIAYRIWTK